MVGGEKFHERMGELDMNPLYNLVKASLHDKVTSVVDLVKNARVRATILRETIEFEYEDGKQLYGEMRKNLPDVWREAVMLRKHTRAVSGTLVAYRWQIDLPKKEILANWDITPGFIDTANRPGDWGSETCPGEFEPLVVLCSFSPKKLRLYEKYEILRNLGTANESQGEILAMLGIKAVLVTGYNGVLYILAETELGTWTGRKNAQE